MSIQPLNSAYGFLNGDISYTGAILTRIVAGIPIPRLKNDGQTENWKTWSELSPLTDPWTNRFPASVRAQIRWIDVEEYATSNRPNNGTPDNPNDDGGFYALGDTSQRTFFTRWGRAANNLQLPFVQQPWPAAFGTSSKTIPGTTTTWGPLGESDVRSPMAVTLDGIPLKFAELKDAVPGASHNWMRVDGAGGINTFFLPIPEAFGTLNALPSLPISESLQDDDLLATTFPESDWQAWTSAVHKIRISSDPQNPRYEIHLHPDFHPAGPGNSASAFNKRQRVRLWNAPEFLMAQGSFVMQTALKRIYFLIPSAPSNEDQAAEEVMADTRVRPLAMFSDPPTNNSYQGSMLEVSCPNYQANESQVIQGPIIISNRAPTVNDPGLNWSSFILENIRISSGIGYGVRTEKVNSITFFQTFFRNFGANNVSLLNNGTSSILYSTFRGGYRGQVQAQNHQWGNNPNKNLDRSAFASPTNTPEFPSTPMVDYLGAGRFFIDYSSFVDTGLVYPETAAVYTNGYQSKATIENSTFKKQSGPAISWGGFANIIRNNLFQDCVLSQSDAGAIYFARTWGQMANRIENNTFKDIYNRTPYSGTKPIHVDHVNGVFIDDLSFGFIVKGNKFQSTSSFPAFSNHRGVKINAGAWHVLQQDWANSSADYSNNENKYQVAKNGFSILVSDTSGRERFYQNYRELGEIFNCSAFAPASGATISDSYHEMMEEVALASTGLTGSFTSFQISSWYSDLLDNLTRGTSGVGSWRSATVPYDDLIVPGSGFGFTKVFENGIHTKWKWDNGKIAYDVEPMN